jgi:hypothetical protein
VAGVVSTPNPRWPSCTFSFRRRPLDAAVAWALGPALAASRSVVERGLTGGILDVGAW